MSAPAHGGPPMTMREIVDAEDSEDFLSPYTRFFVARLAELHGVDELEIVDRLLNFWASDHAEYMASAGAGLKEFVQWRDANSKGE